MMNEIKRNELNEQEMNQVTGGYDLHYYNIVRDFERMKQQEEARQKREAMMQANRDRANQYNANQANENQSTIHAHGGGVSGGW